MTCTTLKMFFLCYYRQCQAAKNCDSSRMTRDASSWLAVGQDLNSTSAQQFLCEYYVLFGSHVTVIYCEQNSLNYMHGTMYTISNAKKGCYWSYSSSTGFVQIKVHDYILFHLIGSTLHRQGISKFLFELLDKKRYLLQNYKDFKKPIYALVT